MVMMSQSRCYVSQVSDWTRLFPLILGSGGASSLRSRFENMAQANEEEALKRKEEERLRREAKDRADKERSIQAEEVSVVTWYVLTWHDMVTN